MGVPASPRSLGLGANPTGASAALALPAVDVLGEYYSVQYYQDMTRTIR